MLPPVADQVEPVRLDGQVEDPFPLPVLVSPDSFIVSLDVAFFLIMRYCPHRENDQGEE